MMLEDKAALKIQSFFASYQLKKQNMAQQAIATSPASKLLRAFDLRFQCMRAVAAAKFPINKPIEDAAQVERVIASIRELAMKKGIVNLDAIERLFRQNIVLAERIQAPYYHLIWQKSYFDIARVDNQRLVNYAYDQLRSIVRMFNLPIAYDTEKTEYTSSDALSLAREVIQNASKMIIDALAELEHFSNAVLQEDLSHSFEKMLSVYMTPDCLSKSKVNMQLMVDNINHCSIHTPSING